MTAYVILGQVADLLLDIAGDSKEHVRMNTDPNRDQKYFTIHRSLTLEDMKAHLRGTRTLGATLQHTDSTTRALCFDIDDKPTDPVSWQQIQEAARLLIASGYQPLLEPSPAHRGGHLWIIFSERVSAKAAYSQVCALAPVLKEVVEYWPGERNQKVRLPAGKYVTPESSHWTHLTDAAGEEVKISDLLFYQTPASLIPAAAPPAASKPAPRSRENQCAPEQPQCHHQCEPDEYHKRKYGEQSLWVAWPDETYLIDRFNREYSIDDLATYERNGMINASTIGRPERTASVAVTRDGQRFTDFGATARREDGSQDGGDAFEFYVRSRGLDKSSVLRELGQALNREASTEILRAARAGEALPAWVMDILTDKGREIYNQNALRHGHKPLEAAGG